MRFRVHHAIASRWLNTAWNLSSFLVNKAILFLKCFNLFVYLFSICFFLISFSSARGVCLTWWLIGIMQVSVVLNMGLSRWLMVKNLSAKQETWVPSLGQEDPLEKEMAIHSSILAWKMPGAEETCRLQSLGSQRVRHDLVTKQQQLQQFSTYREAFWIFKIIGMRISWIGEKRRLSKLTKLWWVYQELFLKDPIIKFNNNLLLLLSHWSRVRLCATL